MRVEVSYGRHDVVPDDLNWTPAQTYSPRRYYVYAHLRPDGTPFYIGKGNGGRAWSFERHQVWHTFVEQRLQGKFHIAILRDDMAEEEALELEGVLIQEYGEELVNWFNPGRNIDYNAANSYWDLRKQSQQLTGQAKQAAKTDPYAGVELARQALALVHQYSPIQTETGLVEEHRDRRNGDPTVGDPNVIYRLALCLKAAGRWDEIVREVDGYLDRYPDAVAWRAMESAVKLRDRVASKVDDREAF